MEEKTTENNNKKKNRDIYGSFSLSGSEFAISVKSIQEVVNEPESYSPVPLAPDFLLGLFNLRGMIIPVVDLRVIFDFPTDDQISERKIAIIENGNYCVGILFDRTCEVFNGNEIEKSDFNSSGNNEKEKVIEGVFKLDNGKRIIQILNPYELLNLKDLPKTDESVSKKFSSRKKGKKNQCISFKVGSSTCALGIDCIQEIVKVDKIDHTALSDETCLGSINIRGNTVPVIKFEEILGYESNYDKKESVASEFRIIIMKLEEDLFGLLVFSVESILSYFGDDVVEFHVLNKVKKEIFIVCIPMENGEQTILLDHAQVLSHSEVDRITRGHSNLYKEKKSLEEDKARSINKKTYITFSLDDKYALEICEVREVIDYPEEVMNPPNLSPYFKGMINLRGDLIPIIDPRAMYSISENTARKSQKILIFKIGDVPYGFIVDSIDSIVSYPEGNKVKIPEIIYRREAGSLNEDIKEAIQINPKTKDEKTLLILDLNGIISRIETSAA